MEITIKMEPVTFKRPSGYVRYDERKYASFKAELGWRALKAMNGCERLKGAIKMELTIYKRCNPSSQSYGDWDNHAKSICDALNGICYEDDRQIVEGHVRLKEGAPKIEIKLEEAGK